MEMNRNWTGNELELNYKQTDWKFTENGLEMNWKQTGYGLEVDLQMGRKLTGIVMEWTEIH